MAILNTRHNETLTRNGNSEWIDHYGGALAFGIQGDFGGGTATVQASSDGGTTSGAATDIVTGNTLTVAGGSLGVYYCGALELPACKVRITLSGAIDPSLNWAVTRCAGALRE